MTDEAVVQWLLDHGADPNMGPDFVFQAGRKAVHGSGMALQRAACCSSIGTVDLLLERGAKLENSFPLHDAACGGDGRIPMMAHLINLGVDVNSLDSARVRYRRGTPLHGAVCGRQPAAVRFLLENGADPQVADVWGVTPIEVARKSENEEMIAMLEGAAAQGTGNRSEDQHSIIHDLA